MTGMRAIAAVVTAATVIACTGDPSTSTGPSRVSPPAPVVPSIPSPPSPPTKPLADNRRSFIWSLEHGFTILPNPSRVILVSANAINDRGEVAGTVITDTTSGAPRYRAFKWSPTLGFTFLPGADAINSYATDIDDDGNVVGYTEASSDRNAVLWDDSNVIHAIGVRLPFLYSLGIDAGWVFGNAVVDRRSGYNGVAPFRLNIRSGRLEELQTSSEDGGGVLKVNRLGEAAGYDGDVNYGFGGTSDAVVWDAAGARTVAFDCKGKWNCFASLKAINASGIALGTLTRGSSDTDVAFRWSRTTGVEYLTDPSGKRDGVDVAGLADDGSVLAFNGQAAFIIGPTGSMTLIPTPSGYQYASPRAMNQKRQVVGMLF